MGARVIVVHLRRPRSGDKRTDPLYEFGSFGLTGCHRTNLLADQAAAGSRLAFAQGGDLGFRLVMLTPPVDVRPFADRREAFWSPAEMPLRYDTAPVLIDNDGSSDVNGMRELLASVNRNTWREKFSSSFRTRKQPLDATMAAAVVSAWEEAVESGAERANAYWEALPYWDANAVDRDRQETHRRLLAAARGEDPRASDEEDDDEQDVNDASVPAGASCRPRVSRSKPPTQRRSRRGC